MKFIILISLVSIMSTPYTIFDFNKKSDFSDWQIVNDGVMGGKSQSEININEDGNAIFSGKVSLLNNGGFASVRYSPTVIDVAKFEKLIIRCKGPANRFQIRVKSDDNQRHSYIHYFEVTENWDEIEVDMSSMYPTFRGRKLDIPQYPKETLGELAILIGNNKNENFEIEIDWIKVR